MDNAKPIIPQKDRNVIANIISRRGFSLPFILRLLSLNENIGISETINRDSIIIKPNVKNNIALLVVEIEKLSMPNT